MREWRSFWAWLPQSNKNLTLTDIGRCGMKDNKEKDVPVTGLPTLGIVGKGKRTYLFLSGLGVRKTMRLRSGLDLMPVRRRTKFRAAVLGDPNIFHRAHYVLLESSIQSQFMVRSDSARDEAINAWNAQWDAVLLGALFNCDVMPNIQSDCSFDRICRSSEMHLANPYMRGTSLSPYKLTLQDEKWLEKYYCHARELLGNCEGPYSVAVHAMATYRWHMHPRVQLAILWSGIEALFEVRSEITFRVSLCIALFLHGGDKKRAEQAFKEIRELYGMRSSAVHGSKLKTKEKDPVAKSAQLLLSLIRKCAERGSLPKENELLFGDAGLSFS